MITKYIILYKDGEDIEIFEISPPAKKLLLSYYSPLEIFIDKVYLYF